MANIKEDIVLKFITTTDGDIEETNFSAGDEVEVLEEWENHFLIKDDEGKLFETTESGDISSS